MTSQGSAHARFQRAVKRGHLLAAETAARELGSLSPSDALSLVLLYQREGENPRPDCHAEGRGFESLHPLKKSPLRRVFCCLD